MTSSILDTSQTDDFSQPHLLAVLAASVDPIVTITFDGIICSVSDSIERVFGWKPEDLVGHNIKVLMPDPYRSEHDTYLKNYERTGQSKILCETREFSAIRKNGDVFPCEITVSRVELGSEKKPFFSGIIRDISDRKTGEEQMRFLSQGLASVGEAVIITDLTGMIQYVNPAFSKLTGYTSDQAIGQNPRVLNSGQYSKEFYSKMWQQILGGETWSGEVTNQRADGSLYECMLTIAPMFDPGRRIEGFVAVQRDITDHKKADQQLQEHTNRIEAANFELFHTQKELERTVEKLERSNHELKDFAYIASHDLKEPLRGIHNYSTFLIEDYGDKLDDDGRLKLETLCHLSQRLEKLIDTLLYYSRVGRLDMAMKETSLEKIVNDVLDTLRPRIEELEIEVRIPMALPNVHCDAARIGEVFRNLISNAMKYNNKEKKWMEIGFEHRDDQDRDSHDRHHMNGAEYVFYVRDNGIGIRDKHMESVFRMFKRLHGRDKFGGGTGAGMTIVKKIIERHGGTVWIESTLGEGTTFYFTLQGGTTHGLDDPGIHTAYSTR